MNLLTLSTGLPVILPSKDCPAATAESAYDLRVDESLSAILMVSDS